MDLQYYAHVRENANGRKEYQTVAQHLTGTAELCREFAAAFGAEADGELAGLSHDIGKCTDAFQDHLLNDGPTVDHATAGAMACAMRGNRYASACVAGHHGGLPDFGNMRTARKADGTFYGRMLKGREERYLERCGESGAALPPPTVLATQGLDPLQASFWTRMLYSCLVDADFLDTERFMNGERGRGGYDDIPTLLARLQAYIKPWQQPRTELNRLRCEILNTCIEAGSKPKGVYTLTVPTGGGKTVASLAFALRHAAEHGMQRVIYVIPYTSIIDQNARVFRDILGSGNVLEHHSGVQFDLSDGASAEAVRKALATENWDMPVVVTTAVQFFESMYAARSSRCRKLHNLANSVLIFDEAQTLPCDYLRPCVSAIAQLVQHYGVTAVLCTATQPDLGGLFREFAPEQPLRELSPDPDLLYQVLRRVTLGDLGTVSYEALVGQLKEHEQVLCVVNRRKTAQALFAALPQDGSYCLTTLLCAADRRRQLAEIRARLENGLPCRVVSTSLIEAGVDVDFPSAYREQAGLDSLLQTAGRCNRNGKRLAAESPVWLFRLEDCPTPRMIRANVDALAYVQQHFARLDTPEAILAYFRQLYANKASLDRHGILPAFQKGDSPGRFFPFAWAAEQFRLIESPTRTVYLPIGEGKALCEQLRRQGPTRTLLRRLGLYSVNCYEAQLKSLLAAGALEELPGGELLLANPGLYSAEIGLTVEIETGNGIFF
mgnify:CR=1 FL=1